MQHFKYTFLLVVIAFAYTSCVSDSSSDSTKVPTTPPKVVQNEAPKPPVEPPVVQEQPTPAPTTAPKPPKVVTNPPAPKVVTTPPPPKPKNNPPPAPKPTPPPVAKQPVVKTYVPPTSTAQVIKKEYTPPPPVKSGGKIAFDKPTLDYGYIEQGDVINYKFKYTNTGSVPVNILRTDASCGCTQPTYSFLAINPGETGEIGVRFDSKGKLGKMESKVTVLTDAQPEKHVLYLVGTITPPKKEKEEADEEKEKTAKEDEKSKESEEKELVEGENKTEKENTEPEVNKDNPKKKLKDRLPFRGRKLPKGTPPGERNKDTEGDESGRN